MLNYNKIQFHCKIEFEDLRRLRVLSLARRSTISQLIREAIKMLLNKEADALAQIQIDIQRIKNRSLYRTSQKNLQKKGLIP